MYDRNDNRMIAPAMSCTDVDEAYFDELAARGKVVADDVRTHAVTSRHFETYFRAQDIRSFLAVACSLNGRICGAFTCSSIGATIAWSGNQISIVSKIGARATVSLADQFPAASHIVSSSASVEHLADKFEWGC